MAKKWFYSTPGHAKVHGPWDAEELKKLVGAGILKPHDLIWPAGSDPRQAVPADAALYFPAAASVPSTLPDWLADVETVERHSGPAWHEWPVLGVPDWVDDLRRLEGLPPLTAGQGRAPEPASPARMDWPDSLPVPPSLIPDGMALVPPDGASASSSPTREPAAPPSLVTEPEPMMSGAPHAPSIPDSGAADQFGELAELDILFPPSEECLPLLPPPAESPTHRPELAATAEDEAFPATAEPLPKLVAVSPPLGSQATVPPGVEQTSGLPPTFEHRGESFPEVYQRAQAILQQWADLEINRPLILSGDLEAVRRDVMIKAILELLSRYGAASVDRFWKHLEFVLENRKKYFAAVGHVR